MRFWGWALIALSVIGAAAWWQRDMIEDRVKLNWTPQQPDRFSHQAFTEWQANSPQEKSSFAELASFLAARNVADVVPAWQLTRTDAAPKPQCKRAAFMIPPKGDWPHIVPTLRLIKSQIIPVVGPVEVRSGYRTRDFNACVGGASRSQHLSFSGIDVIATQAKDNRALFETLCALHRRVGPANRFGLGAYFDPTKPGRNRVARFHVDTAGYRSWGFSKQAGSSGCRLMTDAKRRADLHAHASAITPVG